MPAYPPLTAKWSGPGTVAALWIIATILNVVDQVRFPDFSEGSPYVSSILYLSATPVFTALIAARIAGSRGSVLPLAGSLLALSCLTSLVWIFSEWIFERSGLDNDWMALAIALITIVASAWLVGRTLRNEGASPARRRLAAAAAVLIFALLPSLSQLDDYFLGLASDFAPAGDAEESFPDIDEERLWTSQPSLVASALDQVEQASSGAGATYLVTVGASGRQKLFGREARAARTVLGRAFGAEKRSVLLANDEDSLYRAPLANNTNLDAILGGLGRKANPASDLIVVYLASHGGRDAELTTSLPDYQRLQPIGAKRLAEALKRSGIRRRVIIISACYAGSWIKPLATDDSIIIAAARADRTSFGCSDERELTYFGEAMLKTPLPAGASLADRFNIASQTVDRWEKADFATHSLPQAFVGKNMTAVWKAPLPAHPAVNRT